MKKQLLSPRRNSTTQTTSQELALEQLEHFGIDPESDFGRSLAEMAQHLYDCVDTGDALWVEGLKCIEALDAPDRIARFNARKFLCFQVAKLLDSLQNSFRASYQALGYSGATQSAKGVYPIFDNVTAVFSATPVVARTATYVYACAEWIEDAFRGQEFMLEIYSRLLNPTSVALANHVVDLEAGNRAHEYMAWNFNSGMAAIDGVLSHLLGRDDIVIASQNLYGGTWQLLHDWFAKPANLDVAVESFEGMNVGSFQDCLTRVKETYRNRLDSGRKIYLFIESPSNPHGDIYDVAALCKLAHAEGIRVILDSTVATPFLYQPLQREDIDERPDFVVHSYTKDMSGTGCVIAGCVIGRNEDMFAPKGHEGWQQTLFWNVYYVKGAFLNADGAFEVMNGLKTMELRMLQKCISTVILSEVLNAHPKVKVCCSWLEKSPSYEFRKKYMFLGLPAPLMTFEVRDVPTEAFQRFFDSLSPTFNHMISLGQSNTIVSCPALTTHSELNRAALLDAGISPTMVRLSVGDESPMDLINHLIDATRLAIDPEVPGFSEGFPETDSIKETIKKRHVEIHTAYVVESLKSQ